MLNRKTLPELIEDLRENDNVINWHEIEPQEAKARPIPESVDGRIRDALVRRGIRELYTHQHSAYEAVNKGENIVAVTPTASGKTMCYNLPVLQAVATDETSRALYIFPTKALAQDRKAN